MHSFQKVLCPTDFSEPSYEGLKLSVELATSLNAGLVVVNVVPVIPALPPDPTFAIRIPEYERALHADADWRFIDATSDMP